MIPGIADRLRGDRVLYLLVPSTLGKFRDFEVVQNCSSSKINTLFV